MGYTKTCFGVHQPESLLFKGSQSVEQLIRNEKVGGSIPLSGTNCSLCTPLFPVNPAAFLFIPLRKYCVKTAYSHESIPGLSPPGEGLLVTLILLYLPTYKKSGKFRPAL